MDNRGDLSTKIVVQSQAFAGIFDRVWRAFFPGPPGFVFLHEEVFLFHDLSSRSSLLYWPISVIGILRHEFVVVNFVLDLSGINLQALAFCRCER